MIKEGNVGKKRGGKEEWNGERGKKKHNRGRIDEKTKKRDRKKTRGR